MDGTATYRSLKAVETYFIPTPPAMNTNLLISARDGCDGGQTKLPPTLTPSLEPMISVSGRHSHAAGGFRGDFWIASSMDGVWGSPLTTACASWGVEVIVKPPTWEMPGIWTSTHWPGRKLHCRVLHQSTISVRTDSESSCPRDWVSATVSRISLTFSLTRDILSIYTERRAAWRDSNAVRCSCVVLILHRVEHARGQER